MLKGIPSIISPELLKILMEMGHGDEIVIADGNFPSTNYGQRVVRCDGHNVPDLLDAILKFFPIDSYSEYPVALMKVVECDPTIPIIWDEYKKIIAVYDEKRKIEEVERFEFYERSKKAFAIIATGEKALYGNIILKKGVVRL
jgi:L-fucose mutarotase